MKCAKKNISKPVIGILESQHVYSNIDEETKDLDAELDQAIVERMQAIANGEEPEKDIEIENAETSEKTQEQAEPKKEIKSEDAPIKDKKDEKKKKEEKKKDKPKKERKQPTLIDDGL